MIRAADVRSKHSVERDGRRTSGGRGFTLVEVMVALVVSALVVGAAYAAAGAVADARSRAGDGRTRALAGPAARAAVEEWLRAAAVLDDSASLVGVDGGGALPADALAFTVEDGGVLHPGPRRVRLWIQRAPDVRPAGLLAEVAPYDGGGGPADTLVLSAAAAGLRARYRTRDRDRPVWVDAWRAATLPEAVELTILPPPHAAADPDAGGLARVLRLPILVPLRWNPDASDATDGRT